MGFLDAQETTYFTEYYSDENNIASLQGQNRFSFSCQSPKNIRCQPLIFERNHNSRSQIQRSARSYTPAFQDGGDVNTESASDSSTITTTQSDVDIAGGR